MIKLSYNIINPIDPWDNPIVNDDLYDDCQIAEFTGCWDDKDNYYEVLFFDDKAYYLNELGELFDNIGTDDWREMDNIYIYYDEKSNKYFEQVTNGNFWYEITKPMLTD